MRAFSRSSFNSSGVFSGGAGVGSAAGTSGVSGSSAFFSPQANSSRQSVSVSSAIRPFFMMHPP